MFGVKLQFWETEDPARSSGLFKMLFDYAWSRPTIGHSALVLTIPQTPENKALIDQYCYRSPTDRKPTIPYTATTTLVPEYHHGVNRVRKEPCYEIYFSWYPSFGRRFKLKNAFLTKLTQTIDKDDLKCMVHPNPRICDEEAEYEAAREKISQLKFTKEYADSHQVQTFRDAYETYTSTEHTVLKNMTIGKQPCQEVCLPISSTDKIGLCVESMHKEMHSFIKDYAFDFYYLNCSHAVRYIVLSGICPDVDQLLSAHLSWWERLPSIWDNPTRLLYTAERLRDAFLNISAKKSTTLTPMFQRGRSHSMPEFLASQEAPAKKKADKSFQIV